MKYLLIAAILIGFSACNKRKTCSVPRSSLGAMIAFKGFNAQELDTMILQSYPPDGLFAQLQRSDTLMTPVLLLKNDTTLAADGFGFFMINPGHNYEIILPTAGRTIHIKAIQYPDIGPYTYESDKEGFCWEQGDFFISPDSVTIEQTRTATANYHGPAQFIFLTR